MKRNELYEKALKKYGETSQIHMVLEEMSELAKELLKDLRNNTMSKELVSSEIADVEITLEQLKLIYEVQEVVKKTKKSKKKRLLRLIESERTLTVGEVIALVQKRYSKQIIGDGVALEIVNEDGEEVFLQDCYEVVGDSIPTQSEVKSFEVERDYYGDDSNKHALIISVL